MSCRSLYDVTAKSSKSALCVNPVPLITLNNLHTQNLLTENEPVLFVPFIFTQNLLKLWKELINSLQNEAKLRPHGPFLH